MHAIVSNRPVCSRPMSKPPAPVNSEMTLYFFIAELFFDCLNLTKARSFYRMMC